MNEDVKRETQRLTEVQEQLTKATDIDTIGNLTVEETEINYHLTNLNESISYVTNEINELKQEFLLRKEQQEFDNKIDKLY